jgi:hypothetical protein
MRLGWITFLGVLTGVVAGGLPATGMAQTDEAFDPHDFTGVWNTNHRGTRGYRSISAEEDIPQRTPWGEAQFALTITGRSSPDYPIGLPPVLGNDPMMDCNPEGFPGVALGTLRPVEFFYAPGRLIMFFEWQRTFREIWLDGRDLPRNPEPRWLGHSVGHWEGDTLVVDSVGFDNRTWLDYYGNIFSEEMRLQERWRRVDKDTLTVSYRLIDPKTYVEPWVGNEKVYTRQSGVELFEEICAPMDEQYFTDVIRDRAAIPANGLDAPGADSEELLLNQFADAVTAIRRIRFAADEEWKQADADEERVAIQDRAIEDVMEAVRETGISMEDYRSMARMINVDPDVRADVFERLAQRDETLARLNVSLRE